MKLFYLPKKPYLSHAFRRLWEGLDLTKPDDATWVDTQAKADLVIAPVINFDDRHLIPDNSVVWQFCYLTANPDADWPSLWNRVKRVVSYLYLPTNYLALPLGYDPKLWYTDDKPKEFDCVVTGYVDGPGAEVISLLPQVFGRVAHVGPNLKLGPNYTNFEQVTDEHLRHLYQTSTYVAGMRHIEGFELPLIEGAACGAIPIGLNLACYRRWFNKFILVNPSDIPRSLQLIKEYNLGVTPDVTRFTWNNVMKGFWNDITN